MFDVGSAGIASDDGRTAHAKDETSTDGVKVDKMSPLRKLVPDEKLEAADAQQYTDLKTQARQKGVLVAETGWFNFFIICFVLALPGMLLLPKIAPWNERPVKK